MQRIIFKTPDNGVGVIVPTPEALKSMTMEELAKKDVPAGAPYRIVDTSEIPTDRTFRDAWEYDDGN